MSDIMLCIRANRDAPIFGSIKGICSTCSTSVWISPLGAKLREQKNLTIVCVACMVKQVEAGNEIPEVQRMTPEQLEEIMVTLHSGLYIKQKKKQ